MEPVTILAITNASIGIARSLVHTVKELYELAEQYETAAMGIRTIAALCNSFRIALDRINEWVNRQSRAAREEIGQDFWDGLSDNVDVAGMVVEELNKRIQGFQKSPTRFWTRTKFIWNSVVIADLQNQMQGLIAAISILLHVVEIPNVGTKRALSRAQSRKLNGLTVSNRRRALESHQHLEEMEQSVTETDHEKPPIYQPSVSSPIVPSETPSSLHPHSDSVSSTATSNHRTSIPRDDADWTLKKQPKRSFFDGFRKKQSSKSSTTQASGTHGSRGSQAATESAQDTTSTLHPVLTRSSELSTTPAPMDEESETSSYFGSKPSQSQSSLTSSRVTSVTDFMPYEDIVGLAEKFDDTDLIGWSELPATRKKDMEISTPSPSYVSQSARIDYSSGRAPTADRFDRVRPSRRITSDADLKESSEASKSESTTSLFRTTSADFVKPDFGFNRVTTGFSSLSAKSPTDTAIQRWQTTNSRNQVVELKIRFEKGEKAAFHNKMSPSAAQLLGARDISPGLYDDPTTTLTLLYTLPFDRSAPESDVVPGDEFPFLIMDEHESPVPMLVFGPNAPMFEELAREKQKIYWHTQAIPQSQRTIETLKGLKYFQIVH